MKKKLLSMITIISLLSIILSACSNTSAEEETTTLRLGHIQSETHPWHKGALKFAELVEEKTDGSVQIDVYPSSTLGGDRDLLEGMQIDTVDFALVAGVMSNFYEPYAILELPYLFEDMDHLEEFLYGPEGAALQEETLQETGIRGLEYWLRGPRQLTSNTAVESPEDLKGMKIRVPSIEASVDGWQAMGANPTPMGFNEVYSSLQTGVIDGQENPVLFAANARIQEVQNYLIMTNHVYGYVQLLMNDDVFQELTKEEQEAVTEAAEEATEYQNNLVLEEDEQALQDMLDEDVELIEVDTTPFEEAVQPVNEELADKYGRELYDTINEMRK
jgi:tripartite ATP-independent transporter DctP family solute receptor